MFEPQPVDRPGARLISCGDGLNEPEPVLLGYANLASNLPRGNMAQALAASSRALLRRPLQGQVFHWLVSLVLTSPKPLVKMKTVRSCSRGDENVILLGAFWVRV